MNERSIYSGQEFDYWNLYTVIGKSPEYDERYLTRYAKFSLYTYRKTNSVLLVNTDTVLARTISGCSIHLPRVSKSNDEWTSRDVNKLFT